MQAGTRRVITRAGASALLMVSVASLGIGPALADESGIIETTGSQKAALMRAMGMSGEPVCVSIALSRSNRRWAIVSATNKCGPNSGHTQVYKKTPSGWKYLFYDMENDGCSRFHMPKAVERDFTPWVC